VAKLKRAGIAIGVVAAAGIVAVGGWAWTSLNTSASQVANNTVKLADFHPTDRASVARGEYVLRVSDCAACHTASSGDLAGGYVFKTGFGVLKSSNITPDRDTGIGNMTERQFFNAIRQGIGSKGFLYPGMPYTEYRKLSDQDVADLYAYMATVKPVSHQVDENGGMRFPYNIRLSLAGWDMLFFHNTGFKEQAGQSQAWNRGKYLVDASGHCAACHTPRNALGAEKDSHYLQGASIESWYALNLTSNQTNGLGRWSQDDIAQYLRSGLNKYAAAAGPMAEAVFNSTQYLTTEDAKDMGAYLKTLPATSEAPAGMQLTSQQQASLQDVYEINCSACHGTHGEGIEGAVPAFAGNSQILGDPTNLVHALLEGSRAVSTKYDPTGAGMPSFAWKFSDKDLAEILDYIRNSWGNRAAPVPVGDVTKLRGSLGAAPQLH